MTRGIVTTNVPDSVPYFYSKIVEGVDLIFVCLRFSVCFVFTIRSRCTHPNRSCLLSHHVNRSRIGKQPGYIGVQKVVPRISVADLN